MDKNELRNHYYELERRFEANKAKRAVKTILAFAVAFFVIFYSTDRPTGLEIIGAAVVSIVMAGIHFLVNGLIFSQLISVSNAENKILENMKKKLQEQ
jgi:hypothetical protein